MTTTLQSNGYPLQLLKETNKTPQLPYVLLFSYGVFEADRWILLPLDIRTAFRPATTLSSIFVHFKDPVSPEQINDVVYCIPCLDCPRAYIGQTSSPLTHCIKEHKKGVILSYFAVRDVHYNYSPMDAKMYWYEEYLTSKYVHLYCSY